MDWIKSKTAWIGVIIVTALVLMGMTLYSSKGHAADKGGARAAPAADAAPMLHPWNGCGVGVQGGGAIGEVAPTGSPVAISSSGQALGVRVLCDLQMGTGTGALVVGVEVSNDWLWGDLHTIGITRDLTVSGRAGVLVAPSALAFARLGWTRVEMDSSLLGADHLNGWKVGGGLEVKLPTTTPLFATLEYAYGMYDAKDLCGGPCGVDINSHEVRLGLAWKFQPVMIVK